MKPQAPNPDTPMPEDWNPRHWLAYVPWAQGQTSEQVAAASGYSRGHVLRLAKDWRTQYDTTTINPREPGLPEGAQQAGAQAAAVSHRLRWAARQEELADDLGDDIEGMREMVRALIDHYRKPEILGTMEPADAIRAARDLVFMIKELAKVANQAAGIRDVNRTLSVTGARFGEPGPDDPGVEPDLLGELLSVSGTPQDVLDAIEVLAQGHLNETSPGSLYEAVIEVGETEPA